MEGGAFPSTQAATATAENDQIAPQHGNSPVSGPATHTTADKIVTYLLRFFYICNLLMLIGFALEIAYVVKIPEDRSDLWALPNPIPLAETCQDRLSPAVWEAASNFSANNCGTHDECLQQLRSTCKNSPGFKGNSTVYGFGVRLSIYLQWFTSLTGIILAPESRKALSDGYILISSFYCVFVYIFTFKNSCTFKQELDIVNQLFRGGYMCMHVLPSVLDHQEQHKTKGLRWNGLLKLAAYTFFNTVDVAGFVSKIPHATSNLEYPCSRATLFSASRFTYSQSNDTSSAWTIANLGSSLFGKVFIEVLLVLWCIVYFTFVMEQSIQSMLKSETIDIDWLRPVPGSLLHIPWRGLRIARQKWFRLLLVFSRAMLPDEPSQPNERSQPNEQPQPNKRPQSKPTRSAYICMKGFMFVWFVVNVWRLEISTRDRYVTGVNDLNMSGQYLALLYGCFACYPVLRDSFFYFKRGPPRSTSEDEEIVTTMDIGRDDPEQGINLNSLTPNESAEAGPQRSQIGATPSAEVAPNGRHNERRLDDLQGDSCLVRAHGFQAPDGTWQ